MIKVNNKGRKQARADPQEYDLKKTSIEELYKAAEEQYIRISASNQNKWHSIISRGGTRKDKINLMATEIVTNPHTSLQQFEELAHWCFDHNHNFALDSCHALVNIYHDYIFTDKSSLKIFADSIQAEIKKGKKNTTLAIGDLVGYYLEHHIKTYYGQLIKSLQLLLTSSISFVKKNSVRLLTSLTKHSELRRLIIDTLINKFGDQDMEVVNEVYKNLKTQFYQDLQSSPILLESAQGFLFRANLARKAQFYVVNFLNNLNMKFLNERALSKLFQLFYHFFEKLMGEDNTQNSVSSRLFLNSIKGLNKIFSFIKGGNKQTKSLIESKIESVYTIVHKTSNTKAKIQLYLFLFQYHSHIHGSLTDRYYRSLYEFIGHTQILNCSLAELFFDLIIVSVKQDESISRILAFIKRMLQLCITAQANFIATTLIMIGRLLQEKQGLKVVVRQRQNCMADEGEDNKQYDISKREPLYAGAETTLIWELTIFANHYHPTVRKFASHILNGQSVPYQGENPMLELSTTSFLEKMVLKKEKKSQAWKLKNRKNLKKIRKSKYETLVDKPLQDFKDDQKFIKKYLQQRSQIHTNFRTRQPADIQEFADQVIEKEMDRLNPRSQNLQLSLSGMSSQQNEQDEDGDFNEQGDAFEDEEFGQEDQQFEQDQQQFESDEPSPQQFQEDELEGQQQQLQSGSQKQFEEAFNEIGNDYDNENFRNRKNEKRGKVTKRGNFQKKKQIFKNRRR